MKTQLTGLAGILFLLSMASCEKSTELDMDALTMELESCKPNKKKLHVGMEYQGGIIFYLDETGKHGLIAAKEDIGPAPWGCYGTAIPGLGRLYPMDSKTATKILLANCKEPGIAARLCAKYEVREKGENGRVYKDWYMADNYDMIFKVIGVQQYQCGRRYWEPPFGQVSIPRFGTEPHPAKYARFDSIGCNSQPSNGIDYRIYGTDYVLYGGAAPKNAKLYIRPIRDF